MSFNLHKDKRGITVVSVDGQLIVGNRQELKQAVLDAIEGGARKFVIRFHAAPAISIRRVLGCSCPCRRRFASRAGSSGSPG